MASIKQPRWWAMLIIVVFVAALAGAAIWIVLGGDPEHGAAVAGTAAILSFAFQILRVLLRRRSSKIETDSDTSPRVLSRRQLDVPLDQIDYVSRFARDQASLNTVLKLRRMHFKDDVVSSDNSYKACWRNNRASFKIVERSMRHHSGKKEFVPIGYWGLVPITSETFSDFLRGLLTHEDVLGTRSVGWSQVDREEVYLYVVGAVVPARPLRQRNPRYTVNVIVDLCYFAVAISEHFRFAGICGYPSTPEGRELFSTLRFQESPVLIDKDKEQPVCLVRSENNHKVLTRARELVEKFGHPTWEETDKRLFWEDLK